MGKRQVGVIIKAKQRRGAKLFELITAVLAFAATFFILMSGLGDVVGRLLAVIPGIVVTVLGVLFISNKKAKLITFSGVVVLTILFIFASLKDFTGGAANFYNALCEAANENMHRGLATVATQGSSVGDFLFASVISVWMAVLITALVCKWRLPMIVVYMALILGLIAFGVYPAVYSIVILGFALLDLFLYDKEFSPSLFLKCLIVTVLIFSAMIPCFFYTGSVGVREARENVINAAETLVYGSDSLPEGRLKHSYGMSSADKSRLVVKIDEEVSNLYLKGYVGSRFTGTSWRAPDKNIYVEDGYNGILKYSEQGDVPSLQYAKYASLSDNNDRFDIEIMNVGAKRKYIYAPYTMESHSAGEENYDLNVKGKTSDRDYRFTAIKRSSECENITQAQWLIDGDRTQGMQKYLMYEGQYRAFVYNSYTELDENIVSTVKSALQASNVKTINAMTQIIRRYFINNFVYNDYPDKLDSDFISEFFGGKIKNANTAYFATAATMIFRVYGYAARYVEGYYMDFESMENSGPYAVTDKNAHAWTEVYFDGIGWLPIETTLGYFDREGNTAPAPDGTETPTKPEKPDIPPDDIGEKDPPDDPNIDTDRPPNGGISDKTRLALQISMPIVGLILVLGVFFATVFIHRHFKHKRKRNRLLQSGEAYGRSVHFIVQHDTKPIGGFSESNLEKYGIEREKTRRFMTIVEKSVYGLYEIEGEERRFVEEFIEEIDKAVLSSFVKKRKLMYLKVKYIDCIG